ncbi:MAG: phosphate signaling complex protein PhoU [Acidimicrobiia bacterium]
MQGRVHFGEAMEALRVDVDVLGGMAQQAVSAAVAALVDDRSRAAAVIDGDDRLDALFVALEERAYSVIAQQAPVARDLRFLMAALRVMADFEKMGDRAVAVAKTCQQEWQRESETIRLLGRMGDLALGLLVDARRAWLEQDLALATTLGGRDAALDACYRSLIAHLLVQTGPFASGLVLHAHAAGRNLERIADHAVMIGERVGYLLTGDPSALEAEIR